MVCSDSNFLDNETFVNSDIQRRYMKVFVVRNMLSEKRFIFDLESKDLGLICKIEHVIIWQKWKIFFKHPQYYNTQIMKEFYSNLRNTSQKKLEVFVRGILVHYSKKKINTVLGGKNVEDSNHSLFEKMDDMNLDMVRESLCLPGTAWLNKFFLLIKSHDIEGCDISYTVQNIVVLSPEVDK